MRLASALHFAAAILIQNSADALWRVSSRDAASLPLVSTEATFAAIAALQVAALLWFWRPWLRWQHPSGLPDFAYAGLQRPERQLPRFAGMMAAVVAVLMMVSLAPVRQFVSAILKADIVPLRPGNAEAMPVPQRPDDRHLASETRTRAMQTQLDAQLTTINSLRGSLSASEKELAGVRPQIGDLNRQLAELKDNVARLDQRRRELEAAAAKPSPPQPVVEAAAPPVREPPPPPPRAAVPEQSASVFIPAAQAPLRNADAAKSISRTLARPLECNATALNAAGPLILQFDRYQDTLELDHHDTLNQIVEALAFCPKLSLGIAGFTDSRGNAKTNRQLSMRRAELTAKYFEVHGVKKEQMTVEALAERNPIASNTTDEGRARNRRVEVTLRVQN